MGWVKVEVVYLVDWVYEIKIRFELSFGRVITNPNDRMVTFQLFFLCFYFRYKWVLPTLNLDVKLIITIRKPEKDSP